MLKNHESKNLSIKIWEYIFLNVRGVLKMAGHADSNATIIVDDKKSFIVIL